MARDSMQRQMNSVIGGSFPEIFQKFRELSAKYGGMSTESLLSAFRQAGGFGLGNMYTPNPYVQNRRIKAIETRPANFTKDEVGGFIKDPDHHERELRAVEKGLEYFSYPMLHIRTVYQNLLTYHSYVAPNLIDKEDANDDGLWREWKLLEKLRQKINPKDKCHEFCGLALQSGKIFVTPRISVDKPHNKVNYAFLQELPSDWVKIVGYNNISKYTVAFNLMYFCQIGTDVRQFGDLLTPYLDDFFDAVYPRPMVSRDKIVYAKKTSIDLKKVEAAARDGVQAYAENGRWFYWVTLPVDRVFPMEVDDTERNVIPPFAGMFLDLIQLSQMEQIQLDLLQNPLVASVLAEIPYWDNQSSNEADQYKLSNAGRLLFESLWYQMLAANNTSGIGFYAGPFENMRLESLNEAPNATEIVSKGMEDLGAKTGLSAIIPSTSEARAGAVQVSLAIESRMPQTIYRSFERLMNVIIEGLNLKYDWTFHMTGDISNDEKRRKEIREELTLGIQSNLLEYEALCDTCLLNDISISDAVIASEILDKRIPLVSSFHQSATSDGRPPEGGRPRSEGITSDGQEADRDQYGEN